MEAQTTGIIRGTLILLFLLTITVLLARRSLRRSEDPARLMAKWAISLVVLGIMLVLAKAQGPMDQLVSILGVCVTGLVMGIIWAPNIAATFAKPLINLFTGGDLAPENEPQYSTAMGKRQRGLFQEAIYDIRAELEKFPQDLTGHLLLAEIMAVNLKDVAAAQRVIDHLSQQPHHTPAQITMAWNALADWQLSVNKDVAAARVALQDIVYRFPHTEYSMQASQRLAHLAHAQEALPPEERKPITLPPSPVKNLGLQKVNPQDWIKEKTPEEQVYELVAHLEAYPLDAEARENLAIVYAEHLNQLDMAIVQLEQLIECPQFPAVQTVRWLNRMVDLQVRLGSDIEGGRLTLQRILDRFPGTSFALQAERRMATLGNEMPKETPESVPLGNYDQYIGLKKRAK
jgi:hypothetical protein